MMATLTESNLAELGDQRITMLVGERGVGKTHLATVLRSNMEVEHVYVPVYPTNNPLLDTLLSRDISCDVEYVYAEGITVSAQRDIIPQLAALCGDVVSAAVASRIHRVFVFIETRKFLRFLSYQDYCKYAQDPSSTCGSDDVSWIPESSIDTPVNLSLPFSHTEIGASEENMQLVIEKILLGWYDVPTMRAYREAISKFFDLFESCHEPGTVIKRWQVPNQFYNKTRRGIVMEVSTGSSDGKVYCINRLCTPFGEVKLFSTGLGNVIAATSRQLLDRISEIGRVSLIDNKQLGYHGINLCGDKKAIHCRWGHPGESWDGACDVVKHYVVQFNDEFAFSRLVNIEADDVDIFPGPRVQANSYDKDKSIFSQVTDGKKQF